MKIDYVGSPIGSIAILAKALDVSEEYIRQVIKDPTAQYSISKIPKRNGGQRVISDPVKELKIVQRRIIKRILSQCSFPDYLFGSVKDDSNPRDFLRNAAFHKEARDVMAFDIESFFPNIDPKYIFKVYKYLLRMPSDVADVLTKLTTLNGGLPQGAPTSSYLANMVFYDREHSVVKTLASMGMIYSRLVDDITVSSTEEIVRRRRSQVYELIRKMLSEKGLEISRKKYKVTNTTLVGEKTTVTGLIVEAGQIKMPREKVKLIGSSVYELRNKADVSTFDDEYHGLYNRISGLVALYSRINEKKALVHRTVLRQIRPTYTKEKIKKVKYLCRQFIRYAKKHPAQIEEEWFGRKFYKFMYKISIIGRTNYGLAGKLRSEMAPIRPTKLLEEHYA